MEEIDGNAIVAQALKEQVNFGHFVGYSTKILRSKQISVLSLKDTDR